MDYICCISLSKDFQKSDSQSPGLLVQVEWRRFGGGFNWVRILVPTRHGIFQEHDFPDSYFFFLKKKVSFSCIFGQFRLSKAILSLR